MLNENKSVTLNKDDIIEMYHKFLDTCVFVIKIIILFLSITKMIKVALLSFIASVILQVGYHNLTYDIFDTLEINIKDALWYLLVYDYDWFDISLIIIVVTTLLIIIIRIKMITDKIDKKIEELKNTIKQKDVVIWNLNKKLALKTN